MSCCGCTATRAPTIWLSEARRSTPLCRTHLGRLSLLYRQVIDKSSSHVSRLGIDIVAGYVALDGETQARNIAAWTPVVAEVLQGFSSFEDETVGVQICAPCTKLTLCVDRRLQLLDHVTKLYPLAIDLLARDLASEVRESLRGLLYRIGSVKGLIGLARG
jgi:hypothetical protein